MKRTLLLTSFIIAALLWSSFGHAQADRSARTSPPATATGKFGKATVTINYSSPSVKGRQIWGALVPYGKAWRAGANEATVFETDQDIRIEGKKLPAGKYSLFATPGEKEWTFTFNSQTGQWGIKRGGDANFDPANNVLIVTAKPKKLKSFNERLVYTADKKGFTLQWENLEVPVKVK
jgi:hypothetical protein